MARAKRAIGIDIGSSAVKMVELSRAGNQVQLERWKIARIKATGPDDFEMATINALRELSIGMKTKGAEIVTSLPGHEAVFKHLNRPQMDPNELSEAMKLDAAQYIPYDAEDAVLRVEMLDEGDEAEGMRVLFVAVRIDAVDDHLRLLEDANLAPTIVDVDSLALANLFEFNQQLGQGSVALVDIGHQATNIHFCADGVSTYIRVIDWGGMRLTEALERGLRISYEEAENVKEGGVTQAMGGAGPSTGEDQTLVAGGGSDATTETNLELGTVSRPVLAELVREIRRSFDYYEKQLYEKPVERIYLTGGSSKFVSLPELLSEELGTEVLPGNPFQFILYDEATQGAEDIASQAPMLAVAAGLAVREVQP